MCPDHQILSLYIDEELPSPWKEKMDAHLKLCQMCRVRLAQYHKLKAVLKSDQIEISAELKNRVWDKAALKKPETRYNFANTRSSLWNRTVSLPFPAAAAAGFIFIAFLVILGTRSPVAPAAYEPEIATGISSDMQGMIPFSDMNSVIQYLSSEDMADFTVIRLPETRNFSSSGEPALLKAADYPRRRSSR
jgi:hypothetical protein